MGKHTVVIDFDDTADEPSYSAGMIALGGKVVAVAFDDGLERAERLESVQADLLEALERVLAQLESEYMPSDESGDAIVKARTAIARARGEA